MILGRHRLWRRHRFRHDEGSSAFGQSQCQRGGSSRSPHVPGLHRLPDRRLSPGHDRGQSRGVAAAAVDVAGLLPHRHRARLAPLPARGRRPRPGRDLPAHGHLAGRQRRGAGRGRHQPQRRRARLGRPDSLRGPPGRRPAGLRASGAMPCASPSSELASGGFGGCNYLVAGRDAAFVVAGAWRVEHPDQGARPRNPRHDQPRSRRSWTTRGSAS